MKIAWDRDEWAFISVDPVVRQSEPLSNSMAISCVTVSHTNNFNIKQDVTFLGCLLIESKVLLELSNHVPISTIFFQIWNPASHLNVTYPAVDHAPL